jgi:hypothetical protein
MSFFYTNIQSLPNKLDELKIDILRSPPDIIALTETWLTEEIKDVEINIPGYQIFRRDRKITKRGGGVLLYINENIPTMQITPRISSELKLELLIVHIQKPSLVVALVYRPPNQEVQVDDILLNELRNICKHKEIVVVGDFNAPSIDWLINHTGNENSFDGKLLKVVQDEFLVQSIHEATRFRHAQRLNCLDLVFTKDDDSITNVEVLPPLGSSDHNVLHWDYQIPDIPKKEVAYKRSVWKADVVGMKDYIKSLDWNHYVDNDLEHNWDHFKSTLTYLYNTYCPLVPIRSVSRPKWLTRDILREIKKKKRAWKLARNTLLPQHFTAYKLQRTKCKQLVASSRDSYEKQIIDSASENPKKFYSYLNSKLRSRDHIPCIIKDEITATENSDKAQIISDFFESVFTDEPPLDTSVVNAQRTEQHIDPITVSVHEVQKELANLKPDKSAGPDQIPAKLLKELSAELAEPLTTIFRQSLDLCQLPSDWKRAIISPIYKGGVKNSPNSFRPISLTSICCKVLERIVKISIMQFLESKQLLNNVQHGFRQNKSCLSNLLISLESWTKEIDEGFPVDVVYIDFRKAFDSVPHNRLLHKLSNYGITGNLHRWIEQFLVGRSQCVHIGNGVSTWASVRSGVPQGSVLGPLLFLIYVDDINSYVDCNMVMFADDLKLWNKISCPADKRKLQNNIDAVKRWSDEWLLQFNVSKCVILHLRSNNNIDTAEYFVGENALKSVEVEKDLGVLIDHSLKPSSQCLKSANKAMSTMRMIKRAFKTLSVELFTKIYPTFVRPHLEYAIQAWRPWLQRDINLLSNVQRRSTKLVEGLYNLNFEDREKSLNLFPLSYRQNRGDLILAYRIIRDPGSGLNFDDFFSYSTTTNLRGHPWKLKKERSRLLLRQNFFSQRVVNPWNSLPVSVIEAPNVNIFKSRLDHHFLRSSAR